MPALQKGNWVISDRFSGSTLAYQGYGRNLDLELIKNLEEIATQGLTPDITIWLDIEVKESLARRKHQIKDRIEAEGEAFLLKVSKGFKNLAKERRWTRVDGGLNEESIKKQIELELHRINAK